MINLLKNAIESNGNKQNGKINISASYKRTPGVTEICVIDNGTGIKTENLDKIFIPFFTTRENGSGIGLSLSKQIMRMHGGNIKVQSIPEIETIFCLTFKG